jgi:hypothetical protein
MLTDYSKLSASISFKDVPIIHIIENMNDPSFKEKFLAHTALYTSNTNYARVVKSKTVLQKNKQVPLVMLEYFKKLLLSLIDNLANLPKLTGIEGSVEENLFHILPDVNQEETLNEVKIDSTRSETTWYRYQQLSLVHPFIIDGLNELVNPSNPLDTIKVLNNGYQLAFSSTDLSSSNITKNPIILENSVQTTKEFESLKVIPKETVIPSYSEDEVLFEMFKSYKTKRRFADILIPSSSELFEAYFQEPKTWEFNEEYTTLQSNLNESKNSTNVVKQKLYTLLDDKVKESMELLKEAFSLAYIGVKDESYSDILNEMCLGTIHTHKLLGHELLHDSIPSVRSRIYYKESGNTILNLLSSENFDEI